MSLTTSDEHEVKFAPEDDEDLVRYKALSVAAIASLVLALFSFLALTYWMLLLVPVVSIVLALVALRRIAANPSQLTGRVPALLALALAVFFGSWGLSHDVSRRLLIGGQARRHAEQWLELIQAGRLHEAHELKLSVSERKPLGADLEDAYRRDREQSQTPTDGLPDPFTQFMDMPLVKEISGQGPRGKVQFVRTLGINQGWSDDEVNLLYRFDFEENGAAKSFQFSVLMKRRVDADTDQGQWQVFSFQKLFEPLY